MWDEQRCQKVRQKGEGERIKAERKEHSAWRREQSVISYLANLIVSCQLQTDNRQLSEPANLKIRKYFKNVPYPLWEDLIFCFYQVVYCQGEFIELIPFSQLKFFNVLALGEVFYNAFELVNGACHPV